MNRIKIDFSEHQLPDNFKKECQDFADMVCDDKESAMVIDNEQTRLKEKYGLEHKLTNHGYKILKSTLNKYWEGKRLDDQELTLAYILLPKIILYEKVQFRILDMIGELESENKKRWGTFTPPESNLKITMKMSEVNPDFIDGAISVLDGITKKRITELTEVVGSQ